MTESRQKLRHRIKQKLGLRQGRPNFADPKYYDRAKRLLLDVCEIFDQAQLPYTVDAGTLLGLVRDGDLIPWDDDLDLMLPTSAIPALRNTFSAIRQRGWQISRLYPMEIGSPVWRLGDPRVLKIRRRFLKLMGPGATVLDISFTYREQDYYWWEMAKRVCRIPTHFLDETDYLEFGGHKLRVPSKREEYLEQTYGDWRQPRPDFGRDEFKIIVRTS
jgi:hypothetical protein